MNHYSDQTILDWLETHAADILFMRECEPEEMYVVVSYRSEQSGCRSECRAATLRGAVGGAMETEAERAAGVVQ